jgi:hypothetical protein
MALIQLRILSTRVWKEIHKITTSLIVMYGCETWSFILIEDQRLRKAFDERYRKRGLKKTALTRDFIICTLHQISLRESDQGGCDGWGT